MRGRRAVEIETLPAPVEVSITSAAVYVCQRLNRKYLRRRFCTDYMASFAKGCRGQCPLPGSTKIRFANLQQSPWPSPPAKQQNPPCRVHEKIETLPQQGWCPLRCFVLPTSATPVKRAAGGRSASRQWKFGLHKSSVGPQAHTSRTQQAAVSETIQFSG